jgi:GH24 family phage-related lysozyme (muramidase)
MEDIPQEAIGLIKKFERFEKHAYPDPIYGWEVPTIGWGTTRYPDGRKVGHKDTITLAKADEYLMLFLREDVLPLMRKIPSFDNMSPRKKAAIFSFAYNNGPGFYKKNGFASITRVCDSPDLWWNKDWIISQFIKYRAGAPLGLGRRRYCEALVFCEKDYLMAYGEAYSVLQSEEDIALLPKEEEALRANPPAPPGTDNQPKYEGWWGYKVY